MIFKFNEAIFNSQDRDVRTALTRILCDFLDDRFLWDLDNLTSLFLDDRKEIQTIEESLHWKELGTFLQNQIVEQIFIKAEQSAYITDIKKFYLSTITIGDGADEVNPKEAIKILNEKSFVVIENHLNDWNFINGIIKNYANYSGKKNIYRIINKSVEDNYLQPRGFGGGGEIKKNLENLTTTSYNGIYRYKIATLFDSDRNEINEKINNTIFYLLTFLKGRDFDPTDISELTYSPDDVMLWHMLYKREIENYIPLELLYSSFPAISSAKQTELNNLDKDQLDFYNFDFCPEVTKNEASKIFLNNSIREQLAYRCEHHKIKAEKPNGILEDVDELERILLMLAKIV